MSLRDGHECLTNATFNGANASIVYSPSFAAPVSLDNTVEAEFRTVAGGTIFHVASVAGSANG